MAGTVSAGAYTAGVLDFLVEALDEWEHAKQDSRRSIARHNVRLKVISGTSGGGACAATLAKALAYRFPAEAITHGSQRPNPNSVNPLYRLWVYGFGLHDLCAVDSEERVEPLRSLLHEGPSTHDFEQFVSPKGERVELASKRAWVDNPLTVLLTLTNREGVSYTVPYVGNTERYRRHADYARIEFYYGDCSQDSPGWPDAFTVKANENAVLPKPASGTAISWKDAWQFARATAAFPVLFPAVPLSRPAWQYLYQPLIIQSPSGPAEVLVWPPDGSGSQCGQKNSHLSFSAIDGGVLNDHPAELAQHHLAGLVGRNRGEPEEVRRALIHIDPFAGTLTPNIYKLGADNGHGETLVKAAAGAAAALTSQAQFSTQDFSLASEAAGRSRFLIGAARGADSGKAALASGALYAFSGFLSEQFRQHDFMLGRRNCQQFLRKHFHLPSDNPLFGSNSNEGERPIIPLTGTAAVEQVLPDWPLASNGALPSDTGKPDARSALRNRVGLVVERMLDQIGFSGRLMILLVAILPSVISAQVLSSILFRRIVADLRKHRLVSS